MKKAILESMKVSDLEKKAATLKIKGYSKMNKEQLIAAILKNPKVEEEVEEKPKDVVTETAPENETVEETETAPESEETTEGDEDQTDDVQKVAGPDDYIDNSGKKVEKGMRALFRVNARYFPGTIVDMKTSGGKKYISGLLDDREKAQLFLPDAVNTDVRFKNDPKPTEETKKPAEKKAKAKTEKTAKDSKDAPAAGSKSAEIYELLASGMPRKQVAEKLGIAYQFVRSVDVRYFSEK